MLAKLAIWVAKRPGSTWAALQATGVGLLAYVGAALSVWLSNGSTRQFWIISALGLTVISAVSFASRYLAILVNEFAARRMEVIGHAYERLDGLLAADQDDVERGADAVFVPAKPVESVSRVTRALYDLLEAKYQDARLPGESVFFETTFMTKSYLDGNITIAAWANTEGRRPTSLSRRVNEPTIYDRTVTAELYRDSEVKRPEPRLIPDTANATYHHLYPTQHQRIRSTICYPVLSTSSTMLGALVATADRPAVFREEDKSYWFFLFELYVKRLALEALRIDGAVRANALAAPY